jgi:sarcosine oxidase
MQASHDVIVVGLGAMGSAAAFHLARRGQRVLGLDRFSPPHLLGSSHGRSRIIREAYFEHPTYVPLLQRAYTLWDELGWLASADVLRLTGGLMLGRPDSVVVAGAKKSAELHHLPCEIFSAAQVRARFPGLRPPEGFAAVWEPRAGVLFPETCISAHLRQAALAGATLRTDEQVLDWAADGAGIRVTTTRGVHTASQLVLAAGSWINQLARLSAPPCTIERQVLFWFEPASSPARFRADRCPVHLWQLDDQRFFYGFPDLGEGVKVAFHHAGETTTPEAVRRDVSAGEVEQMREVLRRFLPEADGPLRQTAVCLYTNMPDQHFWIDRHPEHPQALIVSPCSGHGFKFASVIGEITADLVTRNSSPFDLSLFRHRRAGRG